MALIKSSQTGEAAKGAIVLDLGDLRRQAAVLMDDAKAQADRIVAEGREQARRLTDGAEQKGYQAGHGKGLAEGIEAGRAEGRAEALQQTAEQLQAVEAAWMQTLDRWGEQFGGMVIDARQSLVTVAMALAERIVKRTAQVDPHVVTEQVRQALECVTRPAEVSIHVHGDDRPLLADALPRLLDAFAMIEHAELVDDPAVERGGCVLTYGKGRIDATLQQQLDRLAETLLPDGRSGQDAVPDETEPILEPARV